MDAILETLLPLAPLAALTVGLVVLRRRAARRLDAASAPASTPNASRISGPEAAPGRVMELRLGMTALKGTHMAAFLLVLLLMTCLALAFVFRAATGDGLASPDAIWAKLMEIPLASRAELLLLVVMGIAGLLAWLGTRRARLHLGPQGMRWAIPRLTGNGLLGQTTGKGQLAWGAIERARVDLPQYGAAPASLVNSRLVLHAGGKEIRLNPFAWVERNGPDHRLGVIESLTAGRTGLSVFLERSPLIRQLRAHGVPVEAVQAVEAAVGAGAQARRPQGFNLLAHRGLRLQLILLAIAGLYALVDGFVLNPYRVIGTMPALPFLAVAMLAAVFVLRSGERAPVAERGAVGVLCVLALAGAVYPALLRANAATGEAFEAVYLAAGGGQFKPQEASLPELDLRGLNVHDYWAAFPPGAEHRFALVRGGLGFDQLDTRPLFAATRAFYSAR